MPTCALLEDGTVRCWGDDDRGQLGDRSRTPHASLVAVGSIRAGRRADVARSFVLAPRMPDFLRAYPDVSVELMLRDQLVDPFAEGVDVLVRIGPLGDSTLIARRLGESRHVVCASPDYVKRRGAPRMPRDLVDHECLGYLREGRPSPWRFRENDKTYEVDIRGRYHANDSDVLFRGALAGHGIVSLFDFLVTDALRAGQLVELLVGEETARWPIHALYPKNRHLVPKVSVFLDFVTSLFGPPRRDAPRQRRR